MSDDTATEALLRQRLEEARQDGRAYDFLAEADRVCDAVGSDHGRMTVAAALAEAYEAGRRGAAPVWNFKRPGIWR